MDAPNAKRKRGRPPKADKTRLLFLAADLGNGTLLIAYLDEDGRLVLAVDPDGLTASPSAIGFEEGDPGRVLYGRAAVSYQKVRPDYVCTMLKRARGNPGCIAIIDAAGRQWTFAELEALLLQWRLAHLEQTLGRRADGVLATVPANYSDAQRRATLAVIEAAGSQPLGVVNEPTAAALAYSADAEGSYTVVVVDVGQGTTDVTALRVEDGAEYTVLSSVGRNDLAGEEMTDVLYGCVAAEAARVGAPLDPEGSLRDCTLARMECETAKRDLASQEAVEIVVRSGAQLIDLHVTREKFADLCAPIASAVTDLVREALERAGLACEDVDRVVLAGGGSRTLCIQEALAAAVGSARLRRDADPETAVVRGAVRAIGLKVQERAAQGDASLAGEAARYRLEGDVALREITSRDVGVRAVSRRDGTEALAAIIARGSTLPASASRVFGLTNGGVSDVETRIVVLEGLAEEGPDRADALATYTLSGLPAGPEEDRVEVGIAVSEDGVIEVTARDTHSGRSLAETLETKASVRGAGSL